MQSLRLQGASSSRRQTGFAELGGHPDFQGRGLGALLFHFAAGEIAACSETAYLHAYTTNAPAIALYEAMDFRIRSQINLSVIKRQPV